MDEGADGSRNARGTVTGGRGRRGDCKGENYEVTSGGACTSFRFRSRSAHCPSCFSRQRGRLILRLVLPPSSRRPGSGWPVARLLAFLTPFFTGNLPLLPSLIYLSLSLPLFLPFVPQKPCSLSGVGPRCSETSYNGVTWPLLSRAPVLRSYPIAYTSPLAESHPRRRSLPLSAPRARVALCIPPGQINGGRGGPFEPDSRVHL